VALRPSTHLRTCSVCPPPTLALFRHVKYKTEATRGLDILPMLLSPAHTRYHHQQHMEAPNNGAANTLLKRPRLAQCSNTPVPCTALLDYRSISPVYCLSVSNDRHYTGYVSSRYCQAGPSPPRAPHGLYTITPLHQQLLTLRLLMSYIYGAPSKARNANVVYIWTYVWQR